MQTSFQVYVLDTVCCLLSHRSQEEQARRWQQKQRMKWSFGLPAGDRCGKSRVPCHRCFAAGPSLYMRNWTQNWYETLSHLPVPSPHHHCFLNILSDSFFPYCSGFHLSLHLPCSKPADRTCCLSNLFIKSTVTTNQLNYLNSSGVCQCLEPQLPFDLRTLSAI